MQEQSNRQLLTSNILTDSMPVNWDLYDIETVGDGWTVVDPDFESLYLPEEEREDALPGWQKRHAELVAWCEGEGFDLEASEYPVDELHEYWQQSVEPALTYAWPIDVPNSRADEVAWTLRNSVCSLVRVGDQFMLAVCGGGMDLSAEIAAAYIAAGFYPPVALLDSCMIAQEFVDARRPLREACIRSCEIAEGWIRGRRERLA